MRYLILLIFCLIAACSHTDTTQPKYDECDSVVVCDGDYNCLTQTPEDDVCDDAHTFIVY